MLFSGSVAHRGVVPAGSVSWPPGAMRNWLGAGKHFLVFPVRGGELINYVGFVSTDERTKESWSAPGDPAAVVEYGVRFTRPIAVPDPDGAVLHVEGSVREVRDDGLAEVDLVATVEGQTVLAKARALVRT